MRCADYDAQEDHGSGTSLIAEIKPSGTPRGSVDTAGPAAVGSPALASTSVFTASGLAPGTHTLVITVTGNTTSGGAHVIIDAFDVTP